MREPIHSGKVSEAALSKSIAVSVVGILLCMICLVGTTWAWYSLSVESGNNEMTGANFDFSVAITESVEPENGIYSFAGGEHTVTLTKTGTATKGFCKVIATKNGEEAEATTYYIVDFTDADSINFTVTGSGTLKLIPMFGTPTEGYDPIPENGIELTLTPLTAVPPQKEEVSQEETTSEEELEPEPDPEEKIVGSTEQQTEQEQQTPANEESEEPDETPEKETTEEQTESPEETTEE